MVCELTRVEAKAGGGKEGVGRGGEMMNGNFDWRCFYVDDFSPYLLKLYLI